VLQLLAVWVTKPKLAQQEPSRPAVTLDIPMHANKVGSNFKGALMAELSRDEVVGILGPVGDVIIAEIIAAGITKVDLAAAGERVARDRKAHNSGPPLEPGPFALVVDILERSRGRGILGEAGSTLE
jgi:hypothetical protein